MHSEAFTRLVALAGNDPDLRAYLDQAHALMVETTKRGRPRRALIEMSDAATRSAMRDDLCRAVSVASGEQRQLLMAQAAALHSSVERRRRRSVLMRTWRDRYGVGLNCHQQVKQIAADLDRRRGDCPQTTGDSERDKLCDKILVCRYDLSMRSIWQDLTS
jgi:hypothetical protein